MKLIIFGGIIIFIGGIILAINSIDDIKVEQQGRIVKMRIEKLPQSCLGTRSNHYTTLSYDGRFYIKKIPGKFCDEHFVGELIDIKYLNETSRILFPSESAKLQLLSAIILGLIGLIMSIAQWIKSKKNNYMNRLALLFVLFLLAEQVQAQNFEGKIIYNNHFISKMENLTDEQLNSIMGTKQEYFIKGGNYKLLLNGQTIAMQLYDYKTNRIYNKTLKSDTLYWFDASRNTDSVTSFEIRENVEKILGYQCDAIIMKTKTGTTTIYYNRKYKVDNKHYTKHNYSNWAFYLNQTKALPLKTVVETNQFKLESTAIEIMPMNLGTDYFILDPKTPVKKS